MNSSIHLQTQHTMSSKLSALTIIINVLFNSLKSLQEFVSAEQLTINGSPGDGEARPVRYSNSSSVVWPYNADMKRIANKYAEAQLMAIIDELLIVGLELSELAEEAKVLKTVLGVDGEKVKMLEVLVGRAKQFEIDIWVEINSRALVQ